VPSGLLPTCLSLCSVNVSLRGRTDWKCELSYLLVIFAALCIPANATMNMSPTCWIHPSQDTLPKSKLNLKPRGTLACHCPSVSGQEHCLPTACSPAVAHRPLGFPAECYLNAPSLQPVHSRPLQSSTCLSTCPTPTPMNPLLQGPGIPSGARWTGESVWG
jgi:hypothetical protein